MYFLSQKFHIKIKIYVYAVNIRLVQTKKGKFEWQLTKQKWYYFRELVTALYRNSLGGHQYLNFAKTHFDNEINHIDLSNLQVVFSLNEYPLNFGEEHFGRCNG